MWNKNPYPFNHKKPIFLGGKKKKKQNFEASARRHFLVDDWEKPGQEEGIKELLEVRRHFRASGSGIGA